MENSLLSELELSNEMSKELVMYCRKNGFNNILSIVNFFLSEKNAFKIEKIATVIRRQLMELCKQYIDNNSKYNATLDMSIRQLYIVENLSQRSLNVCIDANLKTLTDILNYRHTNSEFLHLKNCGQNSNEELLQICEKYDNLILSGIIKGNDFMPKAANERIVKNGAVEFASVELIENIELERLAEIENISVRSKNVCVIANLTSLRLIIQYYYNKGGGGFLSIRNCGQTSNLELIKICQKYVNSVKSVTKVNLIQKDHFTPTETFLNDLKLSYSDLCNVKDCISGLTYIPIFRVINILIDSNFVFHNEKQTIIFKDTFNCYQSQQNYTLDSVGREIGLTRERVRQLREMIYRRIRYAFKFINIGNNKTVFPEYIDSVFRPIVWVNDEEANQINQNENTTFTPLFITLIFSVIYSDRFVRVGDLKTLLSKSILKKPIPNKHLFLLDRAIASKFRFEQFLKYLDLLVCQKRKEENLITYTDLIIKFKKGNVTENEEIINVIKEIVKSDYNSYAEIMPVGIKFYRNTKRILASYITEILQHSLKPLHYSEIHQRLIDQGLEITSEQYTHSVLIRENEIFGLKGAGKYDLRSKGGFFGTIGDVAEQILVNRNEPIPMLELENLIFNELIVSRDSIYELLFHYNNENRFDKDKYGNIILRNNKKITYKKDRYGNVVYKNQHVYKKEIKSNQNRAKYFEKGLGIPKNRSK
jgi:hypothetical protein